MITFGSGDLIAIPTAGILPTNPTPTRFGILQEVTVDFAASMKELFGKKQFPVAVARTTMKPTMKAKSATIFAKTFNDFFFGGTNTAAVEEITIIDENSGAIASATYTVVKASLFKDDKGVTYVATAIPLVEVASAPGAGQYAVNESTGVYTFNSADNGKSVFISYTYVPTSPGVGFQTAITNQAMGSQPQFSMILANSQWQGTQSGPNLMLQLNACIATKLTLNFKNEDFTIPEFEFQAFDDGTGTVGLFNIDQ